MESINWKLQFYTPGLTYTLLLRDEYMWGMLQAVEFSYQDLRNFLCLLLSFNIAVFAMVTMNVAKAVL